LPEIFIVIQKGYYRSFEKSRKTFQNIFLLNGFLADRILSATGPKILPFARGGCEGFLKNN
jgi:hypothetical protein